MKLTRLSEMKIKFYGNYDASIEIKMLCNYKIYLEVALLCIYIIRQVSNLSGMPQIAYALYHVKNKLLKEFDIGDYFQPLDVQLSVPRIVTSKEGEQKSFYAKMFWIENIQNPVFGLTLDVNGFGVLGKEVKYYAIQSINALIRYFALKYRNDNKVTDIFSDALLYLGQECEDPDSIAVGKIFEQGNAVNRILYNIFGNNLY